jgi:hypothetical protein
MRPENSIDAKLDYALEMTFPASDPFTISLPEVERDDVAAPADRESRFAKASHCTGSIEDSTRQAAEAHAKPAESDV